MRRFFAALTTPGTPAHTVLHLVMLASVGVVLLGPPAALPVVSFVSLRVVMLAAVGLAGMAFLVTTLAPFAAVQVGRLGLTRAGFVGWVTQTSTILGIAGVLGVLTALAGHSITLDAAVPLLVTALTGMVMPGRPDAAATLQRVAAAAVLAAHQQTRQAGIGELIEELHKAGADGSVSPPPPDTPAKG